MKSNAVKVLIITPIQSFIKLNIPTGAPMVYEPDENLGPIRHDCPGDPAEIEAKAAAVAALMVFFMIRIMRLLTAGRQFGVSLRIRGNIIRIITGF